MENSGVRKYALVTEDADLLRSFSSPEVFSLQYSTRLRIEHDTTELAFLELHWLRDAQRSGLRRGQLLFKQKSAGNDLLAITRKYLERGM